MEDIHFRTRNEFREWLVHNHDKSNGFWMVYFKKHTGRENIAYEEALEEALCFGWIDSLVKRRDEDIYVRKFTPRVNTQNWSEKNRWMALKLIREGKMTEAGQKKLWEPSMEENGPRESRSSNESGTDRLNSAHAPETVVPDFVLEAFGQHEPALTHFNRMAPSHKRMFIQWITAAKREATVQRRLNKSIQLLKQNQKLGLK